MTDSTVITEVLPTLTEAQLATGLEQLRQEVDIPANADVWRNRVTESLWHHASRDDLQQGTSFAELKRMGYNATALWLHIYNSARNEGAERSVARLTEPTPTVGTVEWAVEDTAIREEFPGPIKDAALTKLRALVRERNALKAKLAEPIGMDDQRIRPLFAKAAAEADEQGYCTIYDQISSAVGIPDRDTLREEGWLESPEWDVAYYVDYIYTVTDRVLVTERVSASDSGDAVEQAGEDSYTMEELVRDTADLPEGATLTEVNYSYHYDTQRVRD